MLTFLVRRWFLCALAIVLVVGMAWPERLESLTRWAALRYSIVAGVLFLMALPLQARTITDALRHPLPAALASLLNLWMIPLLAWGLVALVPRELFDEATRYGILVAATAPCTLASASVWTRRAGGNDAVAMMVTVTTNLVCFVVTPAWLWAMTGAAAEIDVSAMVRKLGLLVVLPMAAAQLLRLSRTVGDAAVRHKRVLSILAQCGILSMVFLGAIQTGLRLVRSSAWPSAADWLLLIAAVSALHLSVLLMGRPVAKRLGINRRDGVAIAIAGSQKTLMVGLQIAMDLGWSIIPMVVYHVSQLAIDTIVTDRWRKEV